MAVISPTFLDFQRPSSGGPWIQQNIFIFKNVVVDVHKRNKDKITMPSIEAQSQ
jgi:hypothetical protein